VPVIGKEKPGRQVEVLERPGSVEAEGQQAEVEIGQFFAAFEEAHRNEEIAIRKKRATESRHGARIRRREAHFQRKDSDRKGGDPRYLLATCFDRALRTVKEYHDEVEYIHCDPMR